MFEKIWDAEGKFLQVLRRRKIKAYLILVKFQSQLTYQLINKLVFS